MTCGRGGRVWAEDQVGVRSGGGGRVPGATTACDWVRAGPGSAGDQWLPLV